MERTLYQLLKDAVERNIIILPGASCSTFALSNWPRNGVKQLLEEKNYHNPDDLIDGACEPLAYYLSSSISNLNLI